MESDRRCNLSLAGRARDLGRRARTALSLVAPTCTFDCQLLRRVNDAHGRIDGSAADWTSSRAAAVSPANLSCMTYSIRSISTDGEFAALAPQWHELVHRSEDANTFLSHAWLHSWWTCYRPDAKLRILLCEKGGQLRGIAPMMISREGLAGRLFRRMRFVGDGTGETDHMNFIVDQEEREQILASLLSAIDEMPWDIAHFNYIPESSQNADQLLRYARWEKVACFFAYRTLSPALTATHCSGTHGCSSKPAADSHPLGPTRSVQSARGRIRPRHKERRVTRSSR